MTAIIIPFPQKNAADSQFEFWKERVWALHPEWDAAQVENMALICMSIDRGVKRLEARAGGKHG